MKILETLKSKALGVLCVVLVTLLIALKFDYDNKVDLMNSAIESATLHESANKRLSDQNKGLLEELERKPKVVIEVVKEVDEKLCDIKVVDQAIKNLKSKKEVTDEKDVADVDDRLPADLKQLLK